MANCLRDCDARILKTYRAPTESCRSTSRVRREYRVVLDTPHQQAVIEFPLDPCDGQVDSVIHRFFGIFLDGAHKGWVLQEGRVDGANRRVSPYARRGLTTITCPARGERLPIFPWDDEGEPPFQEFPRSFAVNFRLPWSSPGMMRFFIGSVHLRRFLVILKVQGNAGTKSAGHSAAVRSACASA